MKKTWLVAIGVVLILGVVALAGCGTGTTVSGGALEIKGSLGGQQEGIWVNGQGEVTAVPDVAVLSLGIEAQAASVEEAQSQAASAMDAVMKALKDQGVADNDIQTQYFNIQRVTRWDDSKMQEIVIGYRVTNTVTAKVRDVTRAGTVIDAVVAAGGDLARVNSIGFTVDDPSPYYSEARQKAVADAAEKAQQLADAAGINLGKLTYISENTYVPSPVYRDVMAAEAAAPGVTTPISAGELEITANVQLVYDID